MPYLAIDAIRGLQNIHKQEQLDGRCHTSGGKSALKLSDHMHFRKQRIVKIPRT